MMNKFQIDEDKVLKALSGRDTRHPHIMAHVQPNFEMKNWDDVDWWKKHKTPYLWQIEDRLSEISGITSKGDFTFETYTLMFDTGYGAMALFKDNELQDFSVTGSIVMTKDGRIIGIGESYAPAKGLYRKHGGECGGDCGR